MLNIDLAPTISALAGVRPGLPEDGRSFVPFLHGRSIPWRHAFLVEYLGENLLRKGGPPPYAAIQTRRYLYVEYQNGWRELYDLQRDPWELNNIAGSPRTKALQATLGQTLQRLYNARLRGRLELQQQIGRDASLPREENDALPPKR